MHPMLTIAVRAARRAGSIINRASLNGGALNVRSKRVNDFVTQVDQAAEEAIIEIVRKAHPDHGFLAEESGRTAGAAEYVWIIDPLDGTTNFIHGFPQYCVSIAVEHRGALAHGVVYDPVKNELFTASRGRGAFLNDRRIRVSKCTRLKESLVGTDFRSRSCRASISTPGSSETSSRTARACGVQAPRLSTWRMSPAGDWTRSGRWGSRRGTWRPERS